MSKLFTKYGVAISVDSQGKPIPDNAERYIQYKSGGHAVQFSGADMSQQGHEAEIASMQMGHCSCCDDRVTNDELDGNGELCAFCCINEVQNGQ